MRRRAKFVEVRRIYVNKYYELLWKEESKEEVYLVCQDTGLDNQEYLELKMDLKEKGGSLFKFMNQHSDFANLSDIFGGGTFCVEWGGLEKFEEKQNYLGEKGCIVLCVLNGNKIHYNSEVIDLNKRVYEKKRRVIKELRKKMRELYQIKWKWNANLSSIKKVSAKAY